MAKFIEALVKTKINCPIATVRKQFFDFDHHIRSQVHRGTNFTIVDQKPDRIHLKVETKILGMIQRDEWHVYPTVSGSLMHEFVAGMNTGGGIEVRFTPQGANATIIEARAFVPNRGIKKLLSPLFRKALQKIGEKSISEDKYDLESGNYKAS